MMTQEERWLKRYCEVNYEKEGVSPYKLSKVILGPKFREGVITKTQIRMMCMERGWRDVEIVESEIKSYR